MISNGLVTILQDSTTVVGFNTNWNDTSSTYIGSYFKFNSTTPIYKIASLIDATTLTLDTIYRDVSNYNDNYYINDQLTEHYNLPQLAINEQANTIEEINKGLILLTDNFPMLPVASNLVAYWSFDENTGNIAYDASGNGNNGTLVNSPDWVDGVSGKCLSFDGVDEYMDCGGDPDVFTGTNEATISFWVKPSSFAGNRSGIVSQRGDGDNIYWQLTTLTTGRLEFYIYDGVTTDSLQSSVLSVDTLYHIVLRYGADDTVTFFIDGVEDKSKNFGTTGDLSNTNNFRIGYEKANDDYFIGLIDEVRIYNTALTPSEVKALYLNPGGVIA